MSYIGGGGGNRTPVRKRRQTIFYVRSRLYIFSLSPLPSGRPGRKPALEFFRPDPKGIRPGLAFLTDAPSDPERQQAGGTGYLIIN